MQMVPDRVCIRMLWCCLFFGVHVACSIGNTSIGFTFASSLANGSSQLLWDPTCEQIFSSFGCKRKGYKDRYPMLLPPFILCGFLMDGRETSDPHASQCGYVRFPGSSWWERRGTGVAPQALEEAGSPGQKCWGFGMEWDSVWHCHAFEGART
jgi:hypothetical protein